MVDFADNADQAAFRKEVRAMIRDRMPPELRMKSDEVGQFRSFSDTGEKADALKEWRATLNERGWVAPAWPKEYGGGELDAVEQYVMNETFAEEMAPRPSVPDVGSTILVHGSDEQKERFLPPMIAGTTHWCQGYSEPGSGSDLASLQTRAVRDGDDFVVNGQKIWTSGAHMANMIFMLTRTDPEAPKHRGITYLLSPMDVPGITVRPLVQMHGAAEFNETFFEDVRIPAANAVGEINRGWYVGATHLDFERSSIGQAVGQLQMLDSLKEFLIEERDAGTGRSRLGSPDAPRHELADRYIEANVGKTLSQRVISMQARGLLPNFEASMTKLFSTEFSQRIARTATKSLGKYGDLRDREHPATPQGGRWATTYMSSVSMTIAGGTSEIQRNVIATRGLGLPRG